MAHLHGQEGARLGPNTATKGRERGGECPLSWPWGMSHETWSINTNRKRAMAWRLTLILRNRMGTCFARWSFPGASWMGSGDCRHDLCFWEEFWDFVVFLGATGAPVGFVLLAVVFPPFFGGFEGPPLPKPHYQPLGWFTKHPPAPACQGHQGCVIRYCTLFHNYRSCF